jgi:glycosyltransferase involved in cell wall biosynthesis
MAHILMVLDHAYPPDLRVENEVKTLVSAGFEVTVLAIGPDRRPALEEDGSSRIIRARIPAQLRNKMRGLAGSFPLLDLYLGHLLKKIHRIHPFDALHAHDLYLFGATIKAGKKLDVPVVGDMHENWVEALRHYKWSTTVPGKWVVNLEKWQKLEDRWTREVDHLIVVIEEMAERLILGGLDPGHITTVPNTIHLDDFASWPVEHLAGFDDPRPRLIYTGGMDRHRGLEELIRAMPLILKKHKSAELVLVGGGAVEGELKELVSSLGLDEQVVFAGWQKQHLVKSYLATCDVGVIPHKKTVHTDHTIPHKLFHYMYMELPCLVSDCKPLKRIVSETKCGLVYASGSPEDLAQKAIRLLDDATLRKQAGAAGAKAVQEKYNWNATATGLVAVYRKLLGQVAG